MAAAPPPPDPNAALIAEAARLNAQAAVATAEAARINAAAAREKASVDSMGLPSFEGKTTLNSGAGAIETLILATDAVAKAAVEIAGVALKLQWPAGGPYAGDFLLFAGDETADFNHLAAVRAEIATYAEIFDAALRPQHENRVAMVEGLAGSVAAVSAIAGLFRTETEVTAVDLTAAISHRVLATAVAARMRSRAILPGSAQGSVPRQKPPVVQSLMSLVADRDQVLQAAAALPPETGDRLKAAVTRFDAFFTRVTSPDSAGVVALAQAAQLEQLLAGNSLVLRVYVEKAGGSLVNRKNIVTFLGGDPVRVSGGLVVSYTITDPNDGRVLAADVLNCRTSIGKLSDIQAGA
jgi:hypothetical protein